MDLLGGENRETYLFGFCIEAPSSDIIEKWHDGPTPVRDRMNVKVMQF